MVRQMLRKVRIIEAGDTKLLPGSLVDIHNFTDANRKHLNTVSVLQQLNQYYLVLLKHHLKQKVSYLQHHSKKQQEFLQMQQLKVSVMTY